MLPHGAGRPQQEANLIFDPQNLIGTVLAGRYAIREHVGTEILGEVYAARDGRTGREVRVKALRSELVGDPRAFERFGREITASWLVAHPNTLEIVDWGEAADVHFLVTEHFPGETLWSWREHHPCEAAEAAEIGAQVASALAAAHGEGVLHRALTPTNVLVGRDEAGDWVVKVRDFGMADLEDETGEREDSTTLNARLGEVRFVAPEYFSGSGASRATDSYSLGALLYFLIVGHPPDHTVDGGAARPSQVRPTEPWYDQLVVDLLAREPGSRPGPQAALRRLEAGVGRRLVMPPRAPIEDDPVAVEAPQAGSVPVQVVAGLGCAAVTLVSGAAVAMAAMLVVWVVA